MNKNQLYWLKELIFGLTKPVLSFVFSILVEKAVEDNDIQNLFLQVVDELKSDNPKEEIKEDLNRYISVRIGELLSLIKQRFL